MHGYATFNMSLPGPQNSCRHEICTVRPYNDHSPWKLHSRDIGEKAKQNSARNNAKCSKWIQLVCNNSDRTWFFHALTFAGYLGRCWKPRPSAPVFNTTHGTWRMLMHENEKPCLIPILTDGRSSNGKLQEVYHGPRQSRKNATLRNNLFLNINRVFVVVCGDNRGHVCGFLVFWLQITIEFQHSVCDDMYVYRDVSQKRSVCRPSMCLSCVCNLELLCESHLCKQCRSRSDCASRSRMIKVHTVCLYVK